MMLSFEPTTTCNLRCPECPSGLRDFSRPKGNAQMEIYNKAISDLKNTITHLYLYFQGEPLMNKNFSEMVKTAKENNIYTVTSTNAHYLSEKRCKEIVESGLDRMIISIDGSTQESYSQYRIGGKLEKVIEGTQNIIKARSELGKNNPEIIFQMLVVAPNEYQISDVEQIASDLGVDDLWLKTAQIYDYENGSDLIPQNDKYSRYKKVGDKWKIKNTMENQCWKLWHATVMTWDGKVIPCCFDKDAKYEMGNISNQSFDDIWKSEAYNSFRNSLLSSRSEIDICQNCSEGTVIWETV